MPALPEFEWHENCSVFEEHGGAHTLPKGGIMGTGILAQVPVITQSHSKYSASHGNNMACLIGRERTMVAIPNARMRLLHFENTFGEAHASEYCLDAMLSFVQIMTRSSKPDAAYFAAGCLSQSSLAKKNGSVLLTRFPAISANTPSAKATYTAMK